MTHLRPLLRAFLLAGVSFLTTTACSRPSAPPQASGPRFALSLGNAAAAHPLDGRLLLLMSTDSSAEPRRQINDSDRSQQVFGVDVEGLAPGAPVTIDASVLGYPRKSLSDIPAGDYWVQGLLHVYETYTRSDGHAVKLPPDHGEGQQWQESPGSPLSTPTKVHFDPASTAPIRIVLDKAIPPLPPVKDTKYVKYIRFQSDRLTKFWGRPTYLGAILVLPQGYDTHPTAHYPLIVSHGHFEREVTGFREQPVDQDLPPANLDSLAARCPNGHEGEWCTKFGYERVQQEYAHTFYTQWVAPGFPRVLLLTIQHANPYYDDSYAVNSENLGPYGDAITYELIPYIEKTYRGLGPWARALYGGSTGGWEALGAQVFYPDEYNGTFANCPDPIDFHAYTTIDIYSQKNAYYTAGPWRRTPRPAERDYLGQTRVTVEQTNQRELVLGTKSRSGQQWDIWEAVFSPVGADGYPKRIWDKSTGEIDPSVAAYWREHYDLVHIMRRDWAKLGPKLRGKITLNVGLSDNFFLNNAVYLAQDFLTSADPPADAKVDYGLRDEHCWSGDHQHPNVISRLTYHSRFIPLAVKHFLATAPAGADVTSWRY